MKIAIVTSSFPLRADDAASSAGLFVRDFATALQSRGHNVHVLTQDKGWGSAEPPAGIRVTCYPWPGGARPLNQLQLSRLRDLRAAATLLRNGKQALTDLHLKVELDHVLAMWAVPAGLLARSLQRSHGVPYSVWCLGSDIWTYGRIPLLKHVVAQCLRSAGHRFADGRQLASEAAQLSGCQVAFLPSSRKLRLESAQTISPPADGPKFLFVGRYERVKGVDVLLEAFAHFRRREGRGTLTMFGGGPCETHLRQSTLRLDLSQYVTVGGYADMATFVSYGLACDAMVIPSRMESIPLVLSDAAQLGKPVIVSDVGDMGHIVRETGAGLVVPADDAASLSQAFSDFAACEPSSFAPGVTRLSKRFDVDEVAGRFLDTITGAGAEA